MFCMDCGKELHKRAKFCGNCGTKFEIEWSGAGSVESLDKIDLAPLAGDLATCKVEIRELSAAGPDGEGEMSVTVKYVVSNDTDQDWSFLDVQMQLLSADGQAVDESRDAMAQTISAGESEDLEGNFWGVMATLLGENPEKAHVVIKVTACCTEKIHYGKYSVPSDAFKPVTLRDENIGNTIKVVSGNFWKTKPDNDNDSRFELRFLIQNLTNLNLPNVRFAAEVSDVFDSRIISVEKCEQIHPGAIMMISGYGYADNDCLIDGSVDISLFSHRPVAANIIQGRGMLLLTSDLDEEDSSNKSEIDCFSDFDAIAFNINATTVLDFSSSKSDIGDGYNYLSAIEIGDVILFDPSVSDFKEDVWSGKDVIKGSFWTESLAERWFAEEEGKKVYQLTYTGFVGFEPSDGENLSRVCSLFDEYDDIAEVYISIKPDLDSPELEVLSEFVSGHTENPRLCSTENGIN